MQRLVVLIQLGVGSLSGGVGVSVQERAAMRGKSGKVSLVQAQILIVRFDVLAFFFG